VTSTELNFAILVPLRIPSKPLLSFKNVSLASMRPRDHRIRMNDGGGEFDTLEDILPADNAPQGQKLIMLIVGKRPALTSLGAGHYFQGTQGAAFRENLRRYGIILAPKGEHEDDSLLDQLYGVTDFVKRPAGAGDEPADSEYEENTKRIMLLIKTHEPDILLFLYKPPLLQLLKAKSVDSPIPKYGFNPDLEEILGARVFLCPLQGVGGVTKIEIEDAMTELRDAVKEIRVRREML